MPDAVESKDIEERNEEAIPEVEGGIVKKESLGDTQNNAVVKPRTVSFNRDVHVKRIAPSRPPALAEAPAPQPPPVRKQSLGGLSREQLAREAERVLRQATATQCHSTGLPPDRFHSLPVRGRRKNRPTLEINAFPTRRRSEELGVTSQFPSDGLKSSLARSTSDVSSKKPKKNTLLNIFKKTDKEDSKTDHTQNPKKSAITVKRSKSDVSDLKSSATLQRPIRKRSGSESEEYLNSVIGKKTQLSPIIESKQGEDYFKSNNTRLVSASGNSDVEKVVLEIKDTPHKEKSTSPEYKVNPVEKPPRTKEPKPPARPKRAKTLTGRDESFVKAKSSINNFGTLPKAKTNARRKLLVDEIEVKNKDIKKTIKETINQLESKAQIERTSDMIHSSQKPVEKLPLTKGQTVDTMVRILNKDKFSPPPKSSLLMPTNVAAHNNNQPFSYTKPSVSPDPNLYIRSLSPDGPPSPINKSTQDVGPGIIYAQVVCGNGDTKGKSGTKQTIHTSVSPGRLGHSDEDEGLGYEENRMQSSFSHSYDQADYSYNGHKSTNDSYRHLEDYTLEKDSPITPRFKDYRNDQYFEKDQEYRDDYPLNGDRNIDFEDRGRGDGMDARRRESFLESEEMKFEKKKAELSHRRELLESRLNARKNRDQTSPGNLSNRYTPEKEYNIEDANPIEATKRYVSETKKYYREDNNLKSGFAEEYTLNSSRNKDGTLTKTETRAKSKFNPETSLFEPVLGDDIDRREFIDRRLAEEPKGTKYFSPPKPARYFPPEPEYEPPSLDSQASGPRYSPEARKFKFKSSRNHESSQDGLNTQSRYVNSKYKQEKFGSSRGHYASNPEIVHRDNKSSQIDQYDPDKPETFHNSLKRNKQVTSDKHYRQETDYLDKSSSRSLRQQDLEERRDLGYGGETSGPESSRSRYETDRERDNKFADSGIENDYRKDSNGDIHSRRVVSTSTKVLKARSRGDLRNESEDEGFASSLLIASERQHTEDNHSPPKSRYLSDYIEEDSEYRQDNLDYRSDLEYKKFGSRREEFVHRERSIDDGSFYDPRIDKFEERKNAVDKVDSKPPKATKKISGLEKVKQLFSRDSSKKSRKVMERSGRRETEMVREEDLRKRYTEYRGPPSTRESKERSRDSNGYPKDYDYSQRRRLATPSPSPSPPGLRGGREQSGTPTPSTGWFKSLDRLSRKKNKNSKLEKDSVITTTEVESNLSPKRYTPSDSKAPAKNLRFFGDTDQESVASGSKQNSTIKRRPQESRNDKSTLTRSGKTLSSSVHALDRADRQESKYKSSSMTNLQNGSPAFDSRQNLLANSYNKEKYNNSRRDLHNISEIHSNSEDESQFRDSPRKEGSPYKEDNGTLKKPPMSPYREKRRSRSHSGSKTPNKSSTLRREYGGSRGDLIDERGVNSSSEIQASKNDVRGSRQELTGSRNELRTRRRRAPPGGSPAGSSTEGESSLQSQRSVVYLHAPTVGDIPGTGRISRGRSRDDVSSVNSSRLQPQTKTVSRSFSVLAPWKPRFYREGYDINYSQSQQTPQKRTEKPAPKQAPKKESNFLFGKNKSSSTKNLTSSKYDVRNNSEERSTQNRTSNSTLTRRSNPASNGRKPSSNGTSTLRKTDNRGRSVNDSSKENISHNIGTLSKSKSDLRSRDYKKSLSSEMLEKDAPSKGMKRTVERERLNRSISMPKDPNKSAGWFKISKKSKKTESTNRLY